MKKRYMFFIVVVLILAICNCNADTDGATPTTGTEITHQTDAKAEETTPTFQTDAQTEATVPTLDSTEYWKIVREEIITMLNQHDLYVSRIESSYPCVHFYVEPGKQTDDGKTVAVGLSQTEYQELYQHIKEELHIILDKYELAKPKTAFHACDSIVGIFFYNWFIDMPMFPGEVTSWQVASYQLDLLEYYHDYEADAYVRMEGFSEDLWQKYVVYTP